MCAARRRRSLAELQPFPGFLSPSNQQRSRLADASLHINRFLEAPGVGSPKATPNSYLRPSLRKFCSGAGPIRAMFELDGRAYFVGGAYFYEFDAAGTVTQRGGPIVLNGNPATISANPTNEIFIVSGGEGYIFNHATNTFSNITSPSFPNHAPTGAFLSSFFLALSGADGRVQMSGINDGFTWNSLNYIRISDFPDKVIQIAVVNDNVAIMGSKHAQLWYANGNANLPFGPIDGAKVEHGIGAVYSAVVSGNHLMMLGRDSEGGDIVWRFRGATPEIISTPAVSQSLGQVGDYSQAQAGSFHIQGHLFYVLYVPGLDLSWVYDVSTGLWYQWGHWQEAFGRWIPWLGTSFCNAWGMNFAGDRQSGAIYRVHLNTDQNYYPDSLCGPLLT